MIKYGIWKPNQPKRVKIHPLRQRKARKGELDGSEYDWFEGRGPSFSLLVYADDATSELMQGFISQKPRPFSMCSSTRFFGQGFLPKISFDFKYGHA
jgi:hypothetical protein